MRIAVGSDHRGYLVRTKLLELLNRLGHEVDDCGADRGEAIDYPDVASQVAGRVSQGEAERGILVSGTGVGMCIAANKLRGVRAATCQDDLTAEMSRRHQNVNVLCLAADLLGEPLIDRMVEIWMKTPFEGGRHARRVDKIAAMEPQPER